MSRYTGLQSDWYARLSDTEYTNTAVVSWEIGKKGSGLWFEAPAGTTFDVSIPRYACWLLDPHDKRFLKAACLHDHALNQGWDRVASAALFASALAADGVSRRTRLAMTIAVIVKNFK